ncbi:HD domain-containing protein [Lichenibacterium dinghuense]|uniref:HD domain-containing protein n=1 Tax=Lichenibacterium dinghuense TaxID=2895977 RepID=UPI003D1720BE
MPALNRFYEWFQHSNTPFFKHYTDHSAAHSLDVFKTGIEFASSTAQRILSARDLSYFLLACFCHDAGMHLTETHFTRLIDHNHSRVYSTLELFPIRWGRRHRSQPRRGSYGTRQG